MTDDLENPVVAKQSIRPADTRLARENNLADEDFEPGVDELPLLTEVGIHDAEDNVVERVPCPEWDGYVFVRNPTGNERNKFEQEGTIRKGRNREMNLRDLKERLVVWFACKEDRTPIFAPNEPRPIPIVKLQKILAWLREKNAAPINRIADTALDLGGWTEEDVEELVGE